MRVHRLGGAHGEISSLYLVIRVTGDRAVPFLRIEGFPCFSTIGTSEGNSPED